MKDEIAASEIYLILQYGEHHTCDFLPWSGPGYSHIPYVPKSEYDKVDKKSERFTVRYLKEHALRCKIESDNIKLSNRYSNVIKQLKKQLSESVSNKEIQALIDEMVTSRDNEEDFIKGLSESFANYGGARVKVLTACIRRLRALMPEKEGE